MKKILLMFLILQLSGLLSPFHGVCQTITEAIDESYQENPSDNAEAQSNPGSQPEAVATFFSIQTGYFLSQSNANRQVSQLKAQGFEPYIFTSKNRNNKEVFSVRIGKFNTFADAERAKIEFEKTIKTPMIITRYGTLDIADEEAATVSETPAPQAASVATTAPETTPEPGKPLTMTEMQQKLQSMEQTLQRMRDEADIRSQLKITEEEAAAEEEDILEAAGSEYTLTRASVIKFSYGLSYGYSGYDAIREGSRVEDVADHTISNSFGVSYGLRDNLSLGTSIPFVYSYHKVGTIDSLDATDFGDLSINWNYQPIKTGGDLPTIILNGSLGIPVGKNPYDIQPGEELSTSSGIYDANVGVSFSQVTDPVVAFSSFSISYPFATQSIDQKRAEGVLDEVDPGMGLGASVGMGYALSYKLNINMSFSYSYSFSTTYKYENAPDAKSGNSTGANINVGTGYKFSPKQNMNFSIGIPLTSTRSFSLSFSTPIDFVL